MATKYYFCLHLGFNETILKAINYQLFETVKDAKEWAENCCPEIPFFGDGSKFEPPKDLVYVTPIIMFI